MTRETANTARDLMWEITRLQDSVESIKSAEQLNTLLCIVPGFPKEMFDALKALRLKETEEKLAKAEAAFAAL